MALSWLCYFFHLCFFLGFIQFEQLKTFCMFNVQICGQWLMHCEWVLRLGFTSGCTPRIGCGVTSLTSGCIAILSIYQGRIFWFNSSDHFCSVSASIIYWPKDTDKNWNQGFMVFHCSKQVRLHRQEYCLPRMPFGWKGNGAQLFSTRWSPPPLADERKALPDMPPCFFDTLPLCQCALCVTDCIMPRPAPPPWWPPAKILT